MDISITTLFSYVVLVFGGLFPIANPFSAAPVFLALTKDSSKEERSQVALKASMYMAAVLIVSLLGGALILGFFGITIPGLRIAGGIILVILGLRMLFPSEVNQSQDQGKQDQGNIAFTPLAMPMLSGPGSISVVLSMSDSISSQSSVMAMSIGYFVVAMGIILTVLVCWFVLRSSSKIVRFLGTSGIDIMTRLMAFLLVAIGVEFFLGGTTGYLVSISAIEGS